METLFEMHRLTSLGRCERRFLKQYNSYTFTFHDGAMMEYVLDEKEIRLWQEGWTVLYQHTGEVRFGVGTRSYIGYKRLLKLAEQFISKHK